jgi:hypothetical protein
MNQNLERDEKGRIRSKPIGEKPLSKKTITIRLDEETDQKLRQIPNKNEFIRKVLAEAVKQYYQD